MCSGPDLRPGRYDDPDVMDDLNGRDGRPQTSLHTYIGTLPPPDINIYLHTHLMVNSH